MLIGAALSDDVVRHDLREVEHQALVDLGVDVEGVAQLVDPVVQVHGSNLATPVETRKHFGKVVPRVDVCGLVARGRYLARSSPPSRPRIAAPVGPVGPRPVERRAGTASARCRPPARGEHRPVAPTAAATSRADGRRRHARHVDRQHHDQRSAGVSPTGARRDRRTPPRPDRRTPAARGSRRTARSVGRLVADDDDGPGAGDAPPARAPAGVGPRTSRAALSAPPRRGRAPAGQHHRVELHADEV